MEPHLHGGDTCTFAQRYGRAPLDFSVNLNPMGLPGAVRNACKKAIDELQGYPDAQCLELRAALAAQLGLPEGYLLFGGGAADVIFRLAFALRQGRALLPAPTFAEYECALRAAGCAIEYAPLSAGDGFQFTEGFLEYIQPGLDVIFLCNPNNPTGRLMPRPLLLEVLGRCRDMGIRLVVDECCNALLAQPEAATLRNQLVSFHNLFILDAFTKSYAMAGLRLGYGLCADAVLLDKMRSIAQPWAVSAVAQAAGLAALSQADYLGEARALIQTEREFLRHALSGLGCGVFPSDANYLLFFTGDMALHEKLDRRGILLRDCANFRGLGPGYYRVAVRRH